MLLAPSEHRVNNRDKTHAQFRNGILAPRRQFRVDSLDYQAVIYQFFELDVKHTRRGFWQRFVQFARTHGVVAQLVQNTGFPLGINQTDGQPERTIQINRYLSFVHSFKICCKVTAFLRIMQVYTQIFQYMNNFSVLVYMVILL